MRLIWHDIVRCVGVCRRELPRPCCTVGDNLVGVSTRLTVTRTLKPVDLPFKWLYRTCRGRARNTTGCRGGVPRSEGDTTWPDTANHSMLTVT
ncbi:hypothetical protein E2C01_042921 [Portunus trituberculatus]|uniref:Uncharacterized protein n=1 Tax=Portunus trituberculatus TaxID=210409 RepID=A0A5B7FW25_PORTR|nr:hypothetical protein [Portunus trituberculatus]